jgi:DNA-binding response OmpR family regulator
MPGDRGSVLIVEDTQHSAELVAALVQAEGFNPVICADSKSARAAYSVEKPVAILLDWVLPDAPGTELCREMRANDPIVTIIFVSGRGDETSVSRGLDAGADDYVTKPVRGGELIARLEAHLRRGAALRAASGPIAHAAALERRYWFGPIDVDLVARRVKISGKPVKLGPLEFKLVEYLVRNAGVAV